MKRISLEKFKANLNAYIKQANRTLQPIEVVSDNEDEAIVVLSKKEWDGYQETWAIAQNTYLSEKIKAGLAQARSGKVKQRL
ncbi:type II toxin-antitoxin system prevent-host-death family antitoxin [Streptococcus tangpeifui]|uniref:type II toxin-antitoxin system prevent-host-death family antitoxin n=1 Tax=Streptococcus tangpeifui TaxID=2709400 RepID=UPI0013E9C632|nr:type II toxin-antitoxin system prevent-host-death family antitoxin [Streptococcus sp. ZJ373]